VVSTRPLVGLRIPDLFLPSFSLPSSARASFSWPSSHIFRDRPDDSLTHSLARSHALIAPHAQGDEVTALFVCHPPATCFTLLLNVRVREEKRQNATKRNGARTYDSMQWKISTAYWTCKFDLSREHSPCCEKKLSNLLCKNIFIFYAYMYTKEFDRFVCEFHLRYFFEEEKGSRKVS